MSEVSVSVKIEDSDKIVIDKIDIDKPHNDNDEPPHNGKPITKIEVSPNEKYLVTYSEEDNSIVGWNVEDVGEGQLKSEFSLKVNESGTIGSICVSDDKKLAYMFYNVVNNKCYPSKNYLII